MKQSFYEILGVDKKASPEEIHKAYRYLSKFFHPDIGGNEEEMAELNRAYTCLKDPARRQAYDLTGEDKPAPPLDVMIRDVLLECFNDIINKNVQRDLIGHATRLLSKLIQDLENNQSTEKGKGKSLARRRERIKVKSDGEPNLFHLVIDEKIRENSAALAQIDFRLQAFKGAYDRLKNYESIDDALAIGTQSTTTAADVFDWGTSNR